MGWLIYNQKYLMDYILVTNWVVSTWKVWLARASSKVILSSNEFIFYVI